MAALSGQAPVRQSEPAAVAALGRIAERVGRDPGQRSRHLTERLSAEVLARHRDRRGFGLSNRPLQ